MLNIVHVKVRWQVNTKYNFMSTYNIMIVCQGGEANIWLHKHLSLERCIYWCVKFLILTPATHYNLQCDEYQ